MITFLDKLRTEEEKEEEFDKASMVTGSSGERTYFIANYTNGNAVQSNEVDLLALEILDSVDWFGSSEKKIRWTEKLWLKVGHFVERRTK